MSMRYSAKTWFLWTITIAAGATAIAALARGSLPEGLWLGLLVIVLAAMECLRQMLVDSMVRRISRRDDDKPNRWRRRYKR